MKIRGQEYSRLSKLVNHFSTHHRFSQWKISADLTVAVPGIERSIMFSGNWLAGQAPPWHCKRT
jgi:hypothetical protein